MRGIRHGGALFLLHLIAGTAQAQNDTYDRNQLDERALDPVTVTTSLSVLNASHSGRNILVIPGSALQRLPVSSLDELLRSVPGIEVQSRGPMGTQSDIVMRGGTFQQVLVLVDGVRVNDPFSGHFSSYIPVSPAEIDRIEILKGPSAALYGSEAVGGVIQVITKTFRLRPGTEKWQGSGQLSGGSYGLLNAQAGAVYQKGCTRIGGGFLTANADGPQQRGIRGYFHNTTGSVSARRDLSGGWSLMLRGAYDSRDFAAQNFYTSFASDTARERVQTAWVQAALSKTTPEGNSFTISAAYKATNDRYLYNGASIANENKSGLGQLQLTQVRRLSARLRLTNALQHYLRSIRSNDRGNHTENQLAGVSTLSYTSISGFTVVPALRADWQERRGFELVPQLALSYGRKAWRVRASGGKTIRDADFTERYNNYNKPLVTGGRIGNPDLESERAWAWEAGADYFIGKSIKVSGSFFQRFHKGLIDYVPTPYAAIPHRDNLSPTGSYALASNFADVRITGAELDLQYRHAVGAKGAELTGSVGLTWAEAKSGNGATGFYLSSFAKYLLNFNAAWSCRRFALGVTGIYKERASAQSAPAIKADLGKDYFVLNAKAQFFVLPAKAGLFVQADNLFNKPYSDLLGAQMPGIWWQAGAQIKF